MPEPRTTNALILEDEPRFRAFLAEVLRDMNCGAVAAGTAAEAMRLVDASPPDMLLLDLNLPLTDGITFLRQFRTRCPDAPVVIITGFGDLDAAKQAIQLGVTDFLTKPCDLGQLEQAIDRARRRLPKPVPVADTIAAPHVASSGAEEVKPLAAVEREAIVEALRLSGGNRSVAARQLGISRRALYNKIAEYQRDGYLAP